MHTCVRVSEVFAHGVAMHSAATWRQLFVFVVNSVVAGHLFFCEKKAHD